MLSPDPPTVASAVVSGCGRSRAEDETRWVAGPRCRGDASSPSRSQVWTSPPAARRSRSRAGRASRPPSPACQRAKRVSAPSRVTWVWSLSPATPSRNVGVDRFQTHCSPTRVAGRRSTRTSKTSADGLRQGPHSAPASAGLGNPTTRSPTLDTSNQMSAGNHAANGMNATTTSRTVHSALKTPSHSGSTRARKAATATAAVTVRDHPPHPARLDPRRDSRRSPAKCRTGRRAR